VSVPHFYYRGYIILSGFENLYHLNFFLNNLSIEHGTKIYYQYQHRLDEINCTLPIDLDCISNDKTIEENKRYVSYVDVSYCGKESEHRIRQKLTEPFSDLVTTNIIMVGKALLAKIAQIIDQPMLSTEIEGNRRQPLYKRNSWLDKNVGNISCQQRHELYSFIIKWSKYLEPQINLLSDFRKYKKGEEEGEGERIFD